MTGSGSEQEDVMQGLPAELIIDDVSGLKAMADPLRVSILKSLYEPAPGSSLVPARSARMICEQLGESRTTRIYHHIKLLLGAGLIKKVRTTKTRNLTEDFFGPVARLISLSPDLLRAAKVGDDEGWVEGIVALLDATKRDLYELPASTPVRDLRFSHREFRLPPEKAAEFRSRLDALFAEYESMEDEGEPEAVRALLVVYPGASRA